jgi:type VI protein secretion system component VasF
MFLQRYVLHQGNKFDQAYSTMLDQLAGRAPSNPAAIAQWNALMQFWHLPEARAGLYVSSAAFLAVLVIVLSGAAGAITARMSTPRSSNA